MKTAYIVFCSPAGSTGHVAQVITDALEERSIPVHRLDLGAVALNPGPEFNAHCFDCFKCVRECPEDAIISSVPLDKIQAMIRERVEKYNEMPPTQIFY